MTTLKSMPHNDEAEKSVLGAILIDKDAIIEVSEILVPEDYYNDNNNYIYDSMLQLYEMRKPIDLLTLSEQLKKNKKNKYVDSTYLTGLVEQVPTAANVLSYAKIVRENATKRNLIKAGVTIAELGY